jgi:hypothetical protein
MHLSYKRRSTALLIAVGALLLPLAAPIAARADGDDPNGVGVARISLIDGSVAVQRGDTSAPIDAAVNAPVLAADYVTTGDSSHAEVQFDGMSAVRLGDNVQMRFTRIDPGNRQLQLAQGTIELRLLRADGENDVDTPSVSIHPLDAGSYRVTVDPDGRTLLTVRSGRAEVVMPQGNEVVTSGNALLAEGPASSPSVQAVEAVAVDDFDNFNRDRDAHEAPALADNTYVSPNVQGVADLNANGRWVPDNSYGQVWVPSNVAADWAPYRDGRWVWEDYYGWTWVGAEPWGWAPYHYGRWYHSASYGWAWSPGPRAAVAVWQPALVAFIGFGGGVGLSVGFGNIGWVPLAPFEPFHPWWGRGFDNRSGVNVSVNNYYGSPHVYRNALYNGATYVNHERFLQGRFDHPSVMTAAQVRSGEVVRGRVPVVPSQANLRFSDRPAPANLAVRSTFTQQSFAGSGRVVERTPFEQQRAAMTGTIRPGSAEPNRGAGQTNFTQAGRGPNDAWSRFGTQRGSGVTMTQGTRTTTSPGTARSTYGTDRPSGTTYQRPTYNQQSGTTYQRPTYNQQSGTTYQRPTYNQQSGTTYQRPTYNQQSGTTYQRPTYNQQSGTTYQRPTYNQQSGTTYQRPTYNQQSGTTYQRPTYNQPSGTTYQRPTYNQRPSYNQPSGTYQRPAQTYRQPSYSAPARTQQGSRSASPRPTNTQHEGH